MQSVSKLMSLIMPPMFWLAAMVLLAFSVSELALANEQSLRELKPSLSEPFKRLLREASIEEGEEIFMRKCSSCHDHKKTGGNGKGPHLWNLLERQAGTQPGFYFSEAMKASEHLWDLASINYYLTNTERAVPGRIMEFRGIRQDEIRAPLLKFLHGLNDNQQPLP